MQAIHDWNGHLLSHLDDRALSNASAARNRLGNVVPIFDIASNAIRLPNGHTGGYGNITSAFLVPDL